jgi:hypothetical protein
MDLGGETMTASPSYGDLSRYAQKSCEIIGFILEGHDVARNEVDGALKVAARGGHTEIVRTLVRYGANPRHDGNAAMYAAICGEHYETYDLLTSL